MKKLFLILFASLAMAACSGDGNREANRDETEFENTPPAVPDDQTEMQQDETDMQSDTTSTKYMETDTTAMDRQPTP